MMNARKALLLAICLLAALMLTACYTDTDPWPVSDGGGQTQTATDAPAIAPAATDAQAPQDNAATEPPIDTAQPNEPTVTEDPGLNG